MPSRRSTGRTWTPQTTARLFDLAIEGYTQAQIAKQLRRTPKAIERKAAKLRPALASEFRRKSYLTMPFQTIAQTIVSKATDRQRLTSLIASDRL